MWGTYHILAHIIGISNAKAFLALTVFHLFYLTPHVLSIERILEDQTLHEYYRQFLNFLNYCINYQNEKR